jgi:hypothetical protein
MVKLLKDSMMYCAGESPHWEDNVHRDVVLLERWRSPMDEDARAISLIKFGGFGGFSRSEASTEPPSSTSKLHHDIAEARWT